MQQPRTKVLRPIPLYPPSPAHSTAPHTALPHSSTTSPKPAVCRAPDIFKCHFCGATFRTRQGLGGHTSKTHKSLSRTYQHKQEKRQERGNERLVLKLAKKLIHKEDSEFVLRSRKRKDQILTQPTGVSEYDRGRIRRMKSMIWEKIRRAKPVVVRLQ